VYGCVPDRNWEKYLHEKAEKKKDMEKEGERRRRDEEN